MAAQQGIRRASSRGTTLRNIFRLIPAVLVIAATLDTASCNGNHAIFPEVHGGGGNGSNTPTATATAGTGSLAFVTNFNDAKVSSFTRNTTTGVLKLKSEVTAGAKKGPKGIAAAPSGSFVYVANNSDGNIYEFSVNQTNGALTPLSPASISNGSTSGPDEIAINTAGTFLWVTGAKKGTVTAYSISSSTGQLTQVSTKVTGLVNPFGIAVDSTGSFVYVADNGAGLVFSYSVGASGALTQIGSPVFDLGSAGGTPGFIAIDPAGTFIYVTDLNAGVLSVIQTTAGTLAFATTMPLTTTGNVPLGIGYASLSSGNFIYTANQGNSSLWSFLLTIPGNPSSPVEFGTGSLNVPTGLVVDPQNAFLYTTNQNAGTVSQFSLSPTCSAAPGPPCFVGTVAAENPAKSGPFGITLAQ